MKFTDGNIENSILQLGPGNETSEAIIISIKDGHIHKIPSSLKKESQIESFLEQYIKTIHPGPYDQLATDWYICGRGRNRKIFFVVMEIGNLELYRKPGKQLYASFQLENRLKKGKCSTKIKAPFRRPLFSKKHEKTLPHLIVLTVLISLLVFSALGLNKSMLKHKFLKKKVDQTRLELRQDISPEISSEAETSLDELELKLSMLRSAAPTDLYSFLGILSENSTIVLKLESFQYSEDKITFKGWSSETLALIGKLYETGLFQEITPNNILPEEDGQEYYHITGVLK